MSPVFAALPFILCVVAGLKVLRRLLVLGFPASDCNSYVVSGFKWLRQLLVRRLPALHLVRNGAPEYVTTLVGAVIPCISFVDVHLNLLRRMLVLCFPASRLFLRAYKCYGACWCCVSLELL